MLALGTGVLVVAPPWLFAEMYPAPMRVRLPHSLQASRQVPVFGFLPVGCDASGAQVATSAVEVMMTGLSCVPLTKICAPLHTASDPPAGGLLPGMIDEAITVPASIVSVAPGST